MKGIILAGGTGSRLRPLSTAVSKQLMPVFDKPMIYYPLTTLMLAGIREILIICTPNDRMQFVRLLGDGSQLGLEIQYTEQCEPNGIAQAFTISKDHIKNDNVGLILGDNIFYGPRIGNQLKRFSHIDGGAIFAYRVSNPSEYGIVTFSTDGRATSIQEKPERPKSKYAVPGLYFYSSDVVEIAEQLRPSDRGEYEISDINSSLLRQGRLTVEILPRGTAWLDTGTHASLLDAGNYVRTVEERQGQKIGSPEEVAWRMGYIKDQELESLAATQIKSGYGTYLQELLTLESELGATPDQI